MPTTSPRKWPVVVGALVSLALLLALMSWLRPGVPRTVTIVAGPENGATHTWAERYADYARQHGLKAEVVETLGSGESIGDLERVDPHQARATVGFLQSGVEETTGDPEAATELQSLGSLYFEPIWVLVRVEAGIEDVGGLVGKRVYWGRPGTEARAASAKLAQVYEIALSEDTELDLWTPSEAAAALIEGRIDAGVFVGSPSDLQALLVDDALEPLSARHSDVFTRLHPEVGALHIPAGLFSLGQMIPREDIVVMAPSMNLVGHEGLHPALVDLFLDAATRFHTRATLLSQQGEFPGERYTSLPMNPDAVAYYKGGPRGLRKYLPFWAATLIDYLINLGLPIVVVLSTVFKGIPVYLEWKLKLELMRFWKRLAVIENQPERDLDECLAMLASIESESAQLRVPRVHLPSYFELRQEIHDMRDRLKAGW